MLLILSLLLFPLPITSNDPFLVQTTYGTIRGFPLNIDEDTTPKTVKMFLGIPFAKPPINQLRFEASII